MILRGGKRLFKKILQQNFFTHPQIVTLKKGRYRSFVGESQSLLITADADLAKAARSEGLQVWDCINEAGPEHSPETAR